MEAETRVKKVLDLGYKTLYVDIVCSSEPEILEVSIVNRYCLRVIRNDKKTETNIVVHDNY